MKTNWFVDVNTCKQCGSCVDVCPNRIIQKNDQGQIYFREDRKWECIHCGHCMAVCPTSSIAVPGLSYQTDFMPIEKLNGASHEGFANLITIRRAVRSFQQKTVPRELLQQVVDAIEAAPPVFPPSKTELVVVHDMNLMRQALPIMIDLYDNLMRALAHPIARQFVRRKVGREKYITLKNHLQPLMVERLPDLKTGKEDTILRNAPAMILFHANRNSENFRPDMYIAMTFGLLAAHALGLGATAMDLIPPAIDRNADLRAMFHIPNENEVVASMILGYPKHTYQRGIRRELKSVQWL